MMDAAEGVRLFLNFRVFGSASASTSKVHCQDSTRLRRFLGSAAVILMLGMGSAQGAEEAFEKANRLYEEGRFHEAAVAYRAIIDQQGATSTLWFNLGNAYFKANQIGRAIAAYQTGWRLDPRDPSLRFNLQFARQMVTGEESAPASVWRRVLTGLTLNEWMILASVAYWTWLVLLCLREARPQWRRAVSGYTATSGVLLLFLGGCLVGAYYHWYGIRSAVVVERETLVRYGPLEESQVHFKLRDGSELTVLDRKQGEQLWLQVRDSASREGWLKAEDVIVLWAGTSTPGR